MLTFSLPNVCRFHWYLQQALTIPGDRNVEPSLRCNGLAGQPLWLFQSRDHRRRWEILPCVVIGAGVLVRFSWIYMVSNEILYHPSCPTTEQHTFVVVAYHMTTLTMHWTLQTLPLPLNIAAGMFFPQWTGHQFNCVLEFTVGPALRG